MSRPPRTAFYAPAHRVMDKQNADKPLPPDVATSLDFAGNGIQDHRLPYGLYSSRASALGWHGADAPRTVNVVPSTLGSAKISALANAVVGVPVVLAGATTGITVLATDTVFLPAVATVTAGALIIDGAPAFFTYGTGFLTALYNPTTMLGRAVSITGVASGVGGDFLVAGWDAYGYPMTETITATAGATTVNGTKAFKMIGSVTPQFSDAHTYSVGTADVFGLPLFAGSFFDLSVSWNAAAIVAATGFTAGDTTSPADDTTGDVRGTYATQSASDGSKRLIISQHPSLATMASENITVGLFGQPQG